MTDYRVSILLFVIFILTGFVNSLNCWKCISHDCDGDPKNNYKAYKTSCQKGEACMKVRYTMFDNFTTFDSVVRTCSSGTCSPTTEMEFTECTGIERKFRVRGCVLRSCCSDKDLCNTANNLQLKKHGVFLVVFCLYLVIYSETLRFYGT